MLLPPSRRFALTRNDAPVTYGRPRPGGGNVSFRVFAARRPSDRKRAVRPRASLRAAARPFDRAAASSPADSRGRCRAFAPIRLPLRPAMMRTPHSSRPRSAANIRFSDASRLRTCCSRPLVAGEQREQLERNDRRAPEEKLDDRRRARARGAKCASTSCSSCCSALAGEALERRIGNDSPDIAIDRKQPRRAGAGHAGGNAAQSKAPSPTCTRQ